MVFDYIYPFEYYVTLVSCNFKALYPNENEYRKSLLPLIEKENKENNHAENMSRDFNFFIFQSSFFQNYLVSPRFTGFLRNF